MQIDGETMETKTDFIFLGSKIIADSTTPLKDTCSLEEKLWEPRQHIKSRDVTLPTKVHLVKAMVFPVVMYACESWTIHTEEG